MYDAWCKGQPAAPGRTACVITEQVSSTPVQQPSCHRVLTVTSFSEEFRSVIIALRKPHVNILTCCSNHWQISEQRDSGVGSIGSKCSGMAMLEGCLFFCNYFLKFGHPSRPNGFLMIWLLCISYHCIRKKVLSFFQHGRSLFYPWAAEWCPPACVQYRKGSESGCAVKERTEHGAGRSSGWVLEGFRLRAPQGRWLYLLWGSCRQSWYQSQGRLADLTQFTLLHVADGNQPEGLPAQGCPCGNHSNGKEASLKIPQSKSLANKWAPVVSITSSLSCRLPFPHPSSPQYLSSWFWLCPSSLYLSCLKQWKIFSPVLLLNSEGNCISLEWYH